MRCPWPACRRPIHGFIQPTIAGNTVTGDGTSTVTCSNFYYHVGDTGDFTVVG